MVTTGRLEQVFGVKKMEWRPQFNLVVVEVARRGDEVVSVVCDVET